MHINALATVRLVKEHDYLTGSADNLTYNLSQACFLSGCKVTCRPNYTWCQLEKLHRIYWFCYSVCMIQSACYAMQIWFCLFLYVLIHSRLACDLVLSCNCRCENSTLNSLSLVTETEFTTPLTRHLYIWPFQRQFSPTHKLQIVLLRHI
jgi:hypothetical protein